MAAFRGLSSSDDESDGGENPAGGFVRTFQDDRDAKRRRMAAANAAAAAGGGAGYEPVAAAAAADAFFADVEIPSDVEAALRMLRPAQPPFLVLTHHVPGVVTRRATAEAELRDLAARKKLKYLMLPTSARDVAVLEAAELREALAARPAFADFALDRAAALYVTEADLLDALRGEIYGDAAPPRAATGARTAAETAYVDDLRRRGFVRPRRDGGGDAYWFAVPRCGAFAADVLDGRKRLSAAIKRTKYKELNVGKPVAALKKCPLGQEFHVRDLVGRGDADLTVRAAGRFLRSRGEHPR